MTWILRSWARASPRPWTSLSVPLRESSKPAAVERDVEKAFCFVLFSSVVVSEERESEGEEEEDAAGSIDGAHNQWGKNERKKKKKNSPFPHSLQKNTPKSTQWRSPSSARAPSSSPRRPSLPRRRSRPRSRTATTAAAPRRCGPRSRACSTAGSPSRGFSSPSCATCSRARTTRCRSCCCCTW